VAVFVARRSACVASVDVTVLWLLRLFGSGTAEVIEAVFDSTVPAAMPAGAMTVIVFVTGPVPAVFVAMVQLMVPATFVHPEGRATTVRPVGKVSVTATLVASEGPALEIENVYVNGTPATGDAILVVFKTERSALRVIGAAVVALLFAKSGSGVAAVSDAVLLIVAAVNDAAIVPTTVIVALADGAIVPRRQGSAVQPPWLDEIAVEVKPDGSESLTVTALASDGPSFVAVIVHVSGLPGTAGLLADFAIRMSACCATSARCVAVLSVGSGSVTELETVAELTRLSTPAAWLALTRPVTMMVAMVPSGNTVGVRSHVTVETTMAHVPVPVVAVMEEATIPAGSVSTTWTLRATDGPSLPTWIVHVMVSPARTGSGYAVFVTHRSAR
jgi:hypothetical protein